MDKQCRIKWPPFPSGNPDDGPDGEFDSGLLGPGESFSHTLMFWRILILFNGFILGFKVLLVQEVEI